MLVIVGYIIVFMSIFGVFLLAEGQLGALFHPAEFMIIVGAGLGAFILRNNVKAIYDTIKSIPLLFRSSRYNKAMYMDVMALMYRLLSKSRQFGLIMLEKEIDDLHNSVIFTHYPSLLADKLVIDFPASDGQR